jgi:hypothetical protein
MAGQRIDEFNAALETFASCPIVIIVRLDPQTSKLDNGGVTAAGWAAVAAFFAAFCSVINVAISVRLARKGELEK